MKENPKLIEAYRSAWENYDLSLRELQAATEREERSRLDMLLLSVETARLEYSAARDRLAADMLGCNALGGDIGVPASSIRRDHAPDHRVRDTAQLLWELSGKPLGTAENDWLRAERIVRYAAASAA